MTTTETTTREAWVAPASPRWHTAHVSGPNALDRFSVGCSCGHRGPDRETHGEAEADWREHRSAARNVGDRVI